MPQLSNDLSAGHAGRPALPLTLKLIYTAFVVVLVPVYTMEHGLLNFLWLSNLALLGGLVAAWCEHRRLASMLLVSVGLLEMGWIIGFTGGVIRGGEGLFGLTGYMFDDTIPLFVRALSLYHIPMPFVLFWMAWRLGYDRGAWRVWVAVGWAVLVLTFLTVSPEQNVNWVHGAGGEPQQLMPAWLWLVVLMAIAAVAWWLTHRVLLTIFRRFNRVYVPS